MEKIDTRPVTWRRIKKRGKLNQPMAAKKEEINSPTTSGRHVRRLRRLGRHRVLRTGRTLGLNAEKQTKQSGKGYDTYDPAEEEIQFQYRYTRT